MKNFILGLVLFVSLFFSACEGCNGPVGDPVPDPNDTTVVDTTKDTILNPDTVIITE